MFRPLLKALSGLFINLSAGFFGVSIIGPNLSFPKGPTDFVVLTVNIIFGIVFLLLTILCEKEIEK